MDTPEERIRQRRSQLMVHSYIYYKLCDSIVSDHQWQSWANELVKLQSDHGTEIGFYDDVFEDWDGSTGFHLPQDQWILWKAEILLSGKRIGL